MQPMQHALNRVLKDSAPDRQLLCIATHSVVVFVVALVVFLRLAGRGLGKYESRCASSVYLACH